MTFTSIRWPTFLNRRLLIGGLLLWMGCTGVYLAWHDTMTSDEGIHIASAYLAITRHDFRFDPEHPFLFKLLTAVPLLAIPQLHLPEHDQSLWNNAKPIFYDSWMESRSWADNWFFHSGNDGDLMLFLARLPAVLCLVLLGFVTYKLTSQAFGEKIGLAALFFTAFNPTILAHGHLADTDVPVALFFLLTAWMLLRYAKQTDLRRLIWVALALGAGLLTKYSAPALFISTLLCLLSIHAKNRSWRLFTFHLIILLLMVWLLLWLGYFGVSGMDKISHPELTPQGLHDRFVSWHISNDQLVSLAYSTSYFLPLDFLKGIALVSSGTVGGRGGYLLGPISGGGVWYYFPVLYLLKTQLAGLALFGAALYAFFKRRFWWKRIWQSPEQAILFLTVGTYVLFSLANKLNLGIRHIMPLLAFVSIFLALGWQIISSKWLRYTILALYALPLLLWFPNWIGYANAFIFPPGQAWRYFNDSNLEWGQPLRDVATAAQQNFPGQKIYTTWNNVLLQHYGLNIAPLNNIIDPPHRVIILISANQLTDDTYKTFRTLRPILTVSNHSFFYEL